jgi:hypothetical protein
MSSPVTLEQTTTSRRKEALVRAPWYGRSLLVLGIFLPACGLDRLRDDLANPCGPDGCQTTVTCSEVAASYPLLFWSLSGFTEQDILNPDVRNQPELTAIMHPGDVKVLTVRAAGATGDCSGKATSVQWSVSNPVVARLDVAGTPRTASLVALEPGDTEVVAILTFNDGTPRPCESCRGPSRMSAVAMSPS